MVNGESFEGQCFIDHYSDQISANLNTVEWFEIFEGFTIHH